MAVKVTLSNPSSIISTQVTKNPDLRFPRSLYQHLGSLLKNKTILDDYNNGKLPKEYMELLDNLNELADEPIQAVDEYLGSLGSSEDYPYSKDDVDIPLWFPFDESGTIRPVYQFDSDGKPSAQLVDSNGNYLIHITKI